MTYSERAYTGLPDPVIDEQFYINVPAKRLAAWVFDIILTFVFTLVFVVVFTLGLGLFVFPFFFLLFGFIYRTLTIASKSSTWGMRMVGIEFRDREGRKFNFSTAALHSLIYTIAIGVFLIQMISVVMVLISPYGQSLSDMLLGSTAINRPAD